MKIIKWFVDPTFAKIPTIAFMALQSILLFGWIISGEVFNPFLYAFIFTIVLITVKIIVRIKRFGFTGSKQEQ